MARFTIFHELTEDAVEWLHSDAPNLAKCLEKVAARGRFPGCYSVRDQLGEHRADLECDIYGNWSAEVLVQRVYDPNLASSIQRWEPFYFNGLGELSPCEESALRGERPGRGQLARLIPVPSPTSEERNVPTNIYREALDIQDASNLGGLCRAFSRVVEAIQLELRQDCSRAALKNHPVFILWVDKIIDMAGERVPSDVYTKAYYECERRAKELFEALKVSVPPTRDSTQACGSPSCPGCVNCGRGQSNR